MRRALPPALGRPVAVLLALASLALAAPAPPPADGPILDKTKLLQAQTFWDNQDWDWYKTQIPFFECPDADITTTYYYRWELLTKHLTYGSPKSGYTFTEFIDRPFWSGAYGAISCPAGHQLYEARWLRDPRIARDFARYWFRTPGAQPRNYSTWLADSVWALQQVHPNDDFTKDLLPDLIRNYEGWEQRQFVPEVGLFWQIGHDDGMETNINSRQTKDWFRGAPGYRPSFNAYMWADALAIARAADLAGDAETAKTYRAKAAGLKAKLQEKLWDPKRQFFFPMAKQDEEKDGHVVKAGSLTYQTGQFAGSPHGREEIGFVPWQFGMVDPGKGFEEAWKFLMDPEYFFAEFGPTVTERHDPLFLISKNCCVWSGQSWPYATTQTLKALANLLQQGDPKSITRADYLKLLNIFARTHRKEGKPYIAEAAHPDTGSWEGHDAFNHSEHYFHSGFVDLVITGLVGIQPRDDDTLEVRPLAPPSWAYFALDDVMVRGRRVSVVWDRDGTRYGRGKGLRLFAEGREIAHSDTLGPLSAPLPEAPKVKRGPELANFAVNNDGDYFPRVSASYSAPKTPVTKAVDGNLWYIPSPPNRWTTEGSTTDTDWIAVDFGTPRRIREVRVYPLDDAGTNLAAPARIDLETWDGAGWVAVPDQTRSPEPPQGHRANVIRFPEQDLTRIRVVLTHAPGKRSGLTELEAWGDAGQSLDAAPPPEGNLAFNPGDRPFPKASASFTSRFDQVARVNDGKTSFTPNPNNRWTSFESPEPTDWLEIDLGEPKSISRAELAIFDDRGGVQAPADYHLETWDGTAWFPVLDASRSPEQPTGGVFNEVRFRPVKTSKVRAVFTHKGQARSGVSEFLIWSE